MNENRTSILRTAGSTNLAPELIFVDLKELLFVPIMPVHSGHIDSMTPENWKQLKDAFQSLVECPPAERAARLDEVCAGNAELRRELELLLASDDQARSFLEVPPVKIPQDSISQPLVGRTVGHYHVVSLLGRGGMGEVYQAQDILIDRAVALKILPADVAGDPERFKRFVREAQIASSLSHPNVATIYHIDQEDGIPFIAMEYVEG